MEEYECDECGETFDDSDEGFEYAIVSPEETLCPFCNSEVGED